ncbi:hypothetical protein BDW59DRAFT_165174 [Aspergillus cavernicola]|uniref:Major facilitator superfamily domain-containing protein n=1 Tax=Aspergillus cavernicola TaxID=176166 RepID=A0ABR4HV09_9EURO
MDIKESAPTPAGSLSDEEKDLQLVDLEQLGEREGYVLDTSLAQHHGLKTTANEKTKAFDFDRGIRYRVSSRLWKCYGGGYADSAGGCAAAQSFESFMAARILNGFFSTVAQGDMSFFHDQARKINIWSGFIVLSPYMGPLFAAFIINTQIWQWAFGVYAIETGLCLLAIALFGEETYNNRKNKQIELIPNAPRWKRLVGIQQRQD